MSEKKGQLEKLRYDFNTAQGVFIKRNDKMYRVTERDFRSHNGDRYIYTKLPDGTYEYIPYKGPIYYHNTNQKTTSEDYIAILTKENTFGKPIVTVISEATKFYNAEDYHQNYYNQNQSQGYCSYVITPKVEKVRKLFKNKLKK